MTISIYRNGPSEGANNLQEALGATMLRTQGSAFRFRPNKLLINWGSSGAEAQRLLALFPEGHGDKFLNHPDAVGLAVNKLTCLQRLQEQQVPVVPFFTNFDAAMTSVAHGRGRIYARTRLTGSSGEGIRLIMKQDDPQANEVQGINFPVDWIDGGIMPGIYEGCRLFTQGVMGVRNEWRVQCVRGEPVLTQLKIRRNRDDRPEGYTSLVRNVETGWVYSVNYEAANYNTQAVQAVAAAAIGALGLDFGAVDIIQRGDEVFVLEVNTAPGLGEDGSALRAYTQAFQAIYDGQPFEAQA